MKIAMVGSGYVGLVSGACFADFGHEVVCIDKDETKIARLHEGVMPIYEPGLDKLVESNVKAGRLTFTTDLAQGIAGAEAIFIAVGTPSRRGDGHADLSFVYAVAEEIGASLSNDAVVVTKSTVPVGTGDEVERILAESGTTHRFAVVSNPEFLREGAAIGDFKRPDRIVIGAQDEFGREVMREVYRPLFLNESPILFTGRRTSELIKYAANAFLATKITFINEIADLCESVGADVQDVSRGIGMDNRIGSKFLHAGPGYGGSCFPKDTLALLKTAEDYDTPVRVVAAVVEANESRKRAMGRKVLDALGGKDAARGKRVALLGLTFKPNTDDMRDSPAIAVAQTLTDAGAAVFAYDPEGMEAARALMPEVSMCDDPYTAIEGADAIAIVTEWDAFRALDLDRVKQIAKAPVLVDLRNIYRPADVRARGFEYVSVGRS
ncbi:UDP-glucose/GDP-mannose dehydrogenase family protein [Qipengyuania sp. DY56-A-20]|jgi:UDPglucose 6-dehydrogenase|uniref:UDP-glucose 6-dehydrogenase n=1 Tax=Qipengyuania benthica TaxID=3067651 RepID=A0ABT9H664_9SPHN|nr:UDP-glucose/GDP-mannose dehydrogenase family protein [Qipengyuania sp. DY56-A-20]MBU1606240.1 UDP-glucose/GDP-mannose dehydrogenase family protein [Alphaproteobacteria bacterium]MDP4538802.1 UDP-glucose/GDP-mannose dehydrogenase family protein [Qipengyuania sp. DY56-A-20]